MESKSKLREGYSTGSCAAAAAKAAAVRALGGDCPSVVDITTPEERIFTFSVIGYGDGSCGVVKDSGDDPDATNGITITAAVELSSAAGPVSFAAGEGVGTVTLPGLKLPVGEPAINPVPRIMIERAVRDVIGSRGARVTISSPQGREIAKRTFNPRLGIEGGISILGTTGRVKPMDEAALLESFSLEISTHAAAGEEALAVAFAGAGEKALRSAYHIENRSVVQCGNYIGHVVDESARMGIKRLLIGGHPGKLLKVAAGSFRTHNREGGGALEALCTQAAIAGASREQVEMLYQCTTAEEAIHRVRGCGLDHLWKTLAGITAERCRARTYGDVDAAVAFIDSCGAILGATDNALSFAEEIRNAK
ncbi:MAG: cobalt-precorrin-5B (C(1))-methyltransferase CbiD [Synergistes sp.]|nr:cobalt-precorrin-5B (C(1))-methyltransferase CbiD [Synergistes sp.]